MAIRTSRLRKRFSGRATALSLQKAVDVHRASGKADGGYGSLRPYATEQGAEQSATEWEETTLRQRGREEAAFAVAGQAVAESAAVGACSVQ